MAQKFFPVYVVPLEEGLPREGWYVATKLDGGYDIVRYGYGYISDLDIGVLYNVYVPSDFTLTPMSKTPLSKYMPTKRRRRNRK